MFNFLLVNTVMLMKMPLTQVRNYRILECVTWKFGLQRVKSFIYIRVKNETLDLQLDKTCSSLAIYQTCSSLDFYLKNVVLYHTEHTM